MGKEIRVSLSGKDALTATDPDDFALYSGSDWVLIKEKARGTTDINASSSTTISHGLSYLPFVIVFVEDSNGKWRRVHGQSFFDDHRVKVDDTNLTIENGSGSQKTFSYYIFYDGLTSGTDTITESNYVIKVSKSGVSTASSIPTNYIFHSDLNTFKIVSEGTKSVTLSATTSDQSFSQSHGLSFAPLCHAFAKEDGYNQLFFPNSENVDFWGPKAGILETDVTFNHIEADSNSITFNFDNDGSSVDVDIKYYALEKI